MVDLPLLVLFRRVTFAFGTVARINVATVLLEDGHCSLTRTLLMQLIRRHERIIDPFLNSSSPRAAVEVALCKASCPSNLDTGDAQ